MSGDATQTITPYFTVEDADGFIAFLMASFGANVIKDDRYGNGRVQHARLQIGNSLIMLNECTDDYPANVSQMHIYVDDADRAYQSAISLGATSLMQPNERPHGDRMAGVRDPSGNVWWLTSRKV